MMQFLQQIIAGLSPSSTPEAAPAQPPPGSEHGPLFQFDSDGGADWLSKAFSSEIPEWAPWAPDVDEFTNEAIAARIEARRAARAVPVPVQRGTGGGSTTGGNPPGGVSTRAGANASPATPEAPSTSTSEGGAGRFAQPEIAPSTPTSEGGAGRFAQPGAALEPPSKLGVGHEAHLGTLRSIRTPSVTSALAAATGANLIPPEPELVHEGPVAQPSTSTATGGAGRFAQPGIAPTVSEYSTNPDSGPLEVDNGVPPIPSKGPGQSTPPLPAQRTGQTPPLPSKGPGQSTPPLPAQRTGAPKPISLQAPKASDFKWGEEIKPRRSFAHLTNRTQGRPLAVGNIKGIVGHDTSGKVRGVTTGPERTTSYHVTFDKDGFYAQRPLSKTGGHAKGGLLHNGNSVGLAFHGFEGDNLTQAEIDNGAKAVLFIEQQLNKELNLFSHNDIQGGKYGGKGKNPAEASWIKQVAKAVRALKSQTKVAGFEQ